MVGTGIGPVFLVLAMAFAAVVWFLLDSNERRHRKFSAELRTRNPVPDGEMVARYFQDDQGSHDVCIKVRQILAAETMHRAEKLLPDDDLTFFWEELDAAEFVGRLESEFLVTLTPADFNRTPVRFGRYPG